MTTKQQFIEELNPLLEVAEAAITKGDVETSRRASLQVLTLVRKYANHLSTADLRAALNNPQASAIAKRLGVQP